LNKIIHISSDQNSNIDVQIEEINTIQEQKISIWNSYGKVFRGVIEKKYGIKLPEIPEYASNNGHIYYLVCESLKQRDFALSYLKNENILTAFHYLSLHKSDYSKHLSLDNSKLDNADHYSECLLRLPIFCEINNKSQTKIINIVKYLFKEFKK
jgi:dTDP-4-amino-4,6-dideoxygalactose transaminase